jgi:hypothetical protein
MTDFSPLEGALMDGCAPLPPVGRVVRGSSAFGSAEELRVNIKSPDEMGAESRTIRKAAPRRGGIMSAASIYLASVQQFAST